MIRYSSTFTASNCIPKSCLPEVIDEEARPDEVVEVLHDGAGQEEHAVPLLHVHHLPLHIEPHNLTLMSSISLML